ncbi:MAG: hypothetical protein KF795_22870 [Labilithrix sp.]|nr:hypothetical protein [Labilithrix sp.]
MKRIVSVGVALVLASACGESVPMDDASADAGGGDASADPGGGDASADGSADAGGGDTDSGDASTTAACSIASVPYADGATNPANACQVCKVSASSDTWSTLADGDACGDGRICWAGACAAQCAINGSVYASGAANPTEACQSCKPASSTLTWTNASDGTSCGAEQVCQTGACGTGCFIGGSHYAPHAANPTNACQTCAPSVSTTEWTDSVDGTTCDAAKVCASASCAAACYIGGAVRADGDSNPNNPCQTCAPATSLHAWTNLSTGSACDTGSVCNAGNACVAGCFINGVVYASSAVNPGNSCQSCQPGVSTTAWSSRALGTGCATGRVCNAASSCVAGCFVGGAFRASGAANPSSSCQTCQPNVSTTAWTNVTEATSCGAGRYCTFGACERGTLFSHTGARQTFRVPSGITRLTVEAIGGAGGSLGIMSFGGAGGIVKASLVVSPGENLTISVGGGGEQSGNICYGSGGWNGGGDSGRGNGRSGCGGGGGSDVRRGGTGIGQRVLVAGGGGGGGAQSGIGGAGGGASGGRGEGPGGIVAGGGGTQASGGYPNYATQACQAPCTTTVSPEFGIAGVGGDGASTTLGGGGGAGGGYYGGAGGQDISSGGGGGSGWAISTATNVTSVRGTGQGRGEHGRIVVFH